MALKNVLIIGFVWPEPKSSAAGSRMMQLIETFISSGYTITFASACAKTEQAFNLESIGVSQVKIELNHLSFDKFIKTLAPDVVLFDRFMVEEQFGWRVAKHCPNALRVLDTEDLHFLRKGRHQALKDNAHFNRAYLFNDTAKREIASIHRSDLSLIISEVEMEVLKQDFKIDESLLLYLPFMLDKVSEDQIKSFPKFDERQHFISIGNFLHEPNYDTVLYLKEAIWPLIKAKLPEAELHVYGAYVQQKAQQLNDKKQGFLIKGFAEDVNHVMQYSRLCLAPLRFGAGLKGKLVDAMQNGTPCVMTTIAAEGMFGTLSPNGFIEDTPESIAEKAIKLYKNEELWCEKQQNGFQIINKRFSKDVFQEKFLKRVEETFAQLNENRNNNFVGQMLHYHTMQSTKYMGKWIEEKNKNA